ncbi:MAG: prolipoprotein diacylglyceryl transferase [Candidatus Omnitrophica bacterium]|nr:prolipoprotein diacylglyceryl transferase [Candidatus Omnitrophota bacterium]
MYPIVCKIGSFTIYAYGAMMAVAAAVCAFLLQREAKKNHINPDIIFDLVFWVVISGIIGSRLFFVFLNLEYFMKNPGEILLINQGGLAWQGGMILGGLTSVWFIRFKKMPLLKTLDFVIPYAALGQAIGRIGCFLNGCCYGKPWIYGIYFPVHDARLYPTQLYSAANLFVIFIILKFYQARNTIDGRVFAWYFILAATERFFVQFLRADYDPIFLGLGIFQIINILTAAAALYGDTYLLRRARRR